MNLALGMLSCVAFVRAGWREIQHGLVKRRVASSIPDSEIFLADGNPRFQRVAREFIQYDSGGKPYIISRIAELYLPSTAVVHRYTMLEGVWHHEVINIDFATKTINGIPMGTRVYLCTDWISRSALDFGSESDSDSIAEVTTI